MLARLRVILQNLFQRVQAGSEGQQHFLCVCASLVCMRQNLLPVSCRYVMELGTSSLQLV